MAINKDKTVITSVRLPIPLHRLITRAAAKSGVSINDYMLTALTESVLQQPTDATDLALEGVRYAAALRFTVATPDPDGDAYHIADQAALTAELVGGAQVTVTVERLAPMTPKETHVL